MGSLGFGADGVGAGGGVDLGTEAADLGGCEVAGGGDGGVGLDAGALGAAAAGLGVGVGFCEAAGAAAFGVGTLVAGAFEAGSLGVGGVGFAALGDEDAEFEADGDAFVDNSRTAVRILELCIAGVGRDIEDTASM